MKKFFIIIIMSLIASSSCYSLVAKKEKQPKDLQNTIFETIQEDVVKNEISEQKQENIINEVENVIEQQENTTNTVVNAIEQPKESTNESENIAKPQVDIAKNQEIQDNKKKNQKEKDANINKKNEIPETEQKNNESNETSKKTTDTKQPEQDNKSINQSIKENQNTKKIDLSKYIYYERQPDGSYKGYTEDETELYNLKVLVDDVIEKLGYKNVKIKPDSSLVKDRESYFTANRINVETAIYDCEKFNIYYYAAKEYLISPNGTEKYFQTRSYIKVK